MRVVKIFAFLLSLHLSHGCQMEGVATWFIPVVTEVVDVQRGVFFSRTTTNILRIDSITYGEGLRGGPYVDADYTDSIFTISTNNAYPQYEENEISSSMTFTIVFGCTGGSTATLVFQVGVIDTNNNAPQVSSHQFTLTPPLPPGFEITGCLGDIIARDIDLTTRRVDFEIEDNTYFIIEYDEASTVAQSKEFKASLKTSTLIRSIPEPLELTISATDVDDTGDLPITTYSVIRIEANDEFQLPEEPLFARPYYLGNYSAEGVQIEIISLQQGYHEDVQFKLEGEYEQNFELVIEGNALSLSVTSPLILEIGLTHIVLVINAEREYTSGATTTIILQLPQAVPLSFEHVNYEGTIIDNILTPLQLVIIQDSQEGGFNISLNEYSSFFTTTLQGNVITLTMTPLEQDVINENTFISLLVTAFNDHSTATAVVTLDIVKDDVVTPTFEKVIYTGHYDTETGLTFELISLVQGYDDTVSFILDGEYNTYFDFNQSGPNVSLIANSVPAEILTEKHILLTILALKPRTVGANAAITIKFPLARELEFESNINIGSIQEEILTLNTILLSTGFDIDVEFHLDGDYATYFNASNVQNLVTLNLTSPLPTNVQAENDYITLTLFASGDYTTEASTSVLLNILKQDTTTPVFSQKVYVGTYSENNLLVDDIITLVQGYDDSVNFKLDGENSQYFHMTIEDSNILLELQSETEIPLQLIYDEKVLFFYIVAEKPLSVSTTAVIAVTFPSDLTEPTIVSFEKNSYVGSLDNSVFNLEEIILETGYANETDFVLRGDFEEYFTFTNINNIVTISMPNTIHADELGDIKYILLELNAQRTRTVSIPTSIIIEVIEQAGEQLTFEDAYYQGIYSEEFGLQFENIMSLSNGYDDTVMFVLEGEHADFLTLNQNDNAISISLNQTIIQEEILKENNFLVFTIVAYKTGNVPGKAAVIIDLPTDISSSEYLRFSQTYYKGSYEDNQLFVEEITLETSYINNTNVTFSGEYSEYFQLTSQNGIFTMGIVSDLPEITNNVIILILEAQNGADTANATLVIELLISDPRNETTTLKFEKSFYIGKIENDTATIEPIILAEGYSENIYLNLTGELADHFDFTVDDDQVLIRLQMSIPIGQQPDNGIIILDLEASTSGAISAHTAVIFEFVQNITDSSEQLVFAKPFYTGNYNETSGLDFTETITLDVGYDDSVKFDLDEEDSIYFSLLIENNSVTITLSSSIPSAVLINNPYLIFTITAEKPNSVAARTTVVIALTGELTENRILGFNRISFIGSIENKTASLEPIILSEGYDNDVMFVLNGELSNYFNISQESEIVLILLQDTISQEILEARPIIVLELQASAPQTMSAFATIVFEVIVEELQIDSLEFSHPYYTGNYNVLEGLVFDDIITLSRGYDENVTFHLEEDITELFSLNVHENSITLVLNGSSIPESIIENYLKLIFIIRAEKPNTQPAQAIVVISLINDEQITGMSFEKLLYQGLIQAGVVQHETILISGYNGTDVDIVGEYSGLFDAYVATGIVNVEGEGSVTLSEDVNYVVLELRVDNTSAVLLLDVIHSGLPILPIVTFSSPSYVLRVDITQTGKIGQVEATADNGEQVTYSLQVGDDHLLQRVFIDEEGEVYLSAPANSGVYTFQVTATTIFTQATGVAQVHLTVEAITTCGQYDHVVPPLIIIDRDEEEPHRDLVTLTEDHQGCRFNMSSRWPVDQTWLYVDETGLHTTAIDREHESIAFMALSQVQVELILVCDTDQDINMIAKDTEENINVTPIYNHQRQDWLGPYDYGNNKWIITDTILFNPRRIFVNLIVNDINDNYPIFEGKQNEPIVVGYPVTELEEIVIPRALIRLKATDADVGENASLVYWSSEDILAVSPTTGLVHVRNVSSLTDDIILTVHATDRNGGGLTGSLDLLVKLLDVSHIAVVTVKGAFLDDEENILKDLSSAVGYEVKALRSTVIADSETELRSIRMKRQITAPTATLQIYIYGLVGGEPVGVDQLSADITDSEVSTVNLVSTLSLEDYLGNVEICSTSTGLLVATIVLSVLLFILIVAVAVYFILLWRKKQNYDQFSDENSLPSRNDSVESSKPNLVVKPRLNIEELRRSERRLQEMLDAPIEENTTTKSKEIPAENNNIPILEPPTPIIIQSIDKLKDSGNSDDEDEFGERLKAKRKSVVTFNENVEKIIHLEDNSDDDSNDYEIYQF